MIVISAMSQDRIIGKGDGLPWHVPEEYNQFLDIIRGQTVILGRRSYPIFGKGLRRQADPKSALDSGQQLDPAQTVETQLAL